MRFNFVHKRPIRSGQSVFWARGCRRGSPSPEALPGNKQYQAGIVSGKCGVRLEIILEKKDVCKGDIRKAEMQEWEALAKASLRPALGSFGIPSRLVMFLDLIEVLNVVSLQGGDGFKLPQATVKVLLSPVQAVAEDDAGLSGRTSTNI
ncbi:uncharacterized protein MCYG_04053 [Microsporum canis CBS 113480]|uniref:Uncharacterized protein n=1 Tax=Arthroderma otae (strain ATCC MYA-4605 / CBS 113480) TaxID=554155 RepID=C5FMZ8_ARTOC|nr:uncharacterized protein MCYG_04053 [Microsporum canis CBS 113480]EEQ31234.1 predicted protein [Microsporum canis CBS 113480]